MDHKDKLRLIELWKQQPVLWDPDYPDRLSKGALKQAREAIAAELGVEEETVKKTINGLKAQMSGECSKIRKAYAGEGEHYTSKWTYYSALKFLIPGRYGTGDFESLNETSQFDPLHREKTNRTSTPAVKKARPQRVKNEHAEKDYEEEDNRSLNSDNESSISNNSSDDDAPLKETKKSNSVKRNLKRKKSPYDVVELPLDPVDILCEPDECETQPKSRATVLGESTTSLLETLWSEDFRLYREYAMALRSLNSKFEQVYEEKLAAQKSREQMSGLSAREPRRIASVGYETGDSSSK